MVVEPTILVEGAAVDAGSNVKVFRDCFVGLTYFRGLNTDEEPVFFHT